MEIVLEYFDCTNDIGMVQFFKNLELSLMRLQLLMVIVSDNLDCVSVTPGAELLKLVGDSAMVRVRHVRAGLVIDVELPLALIDHGVHALSKFLVHTNFIL